VPDLPLLTTGGAFLRRLIFAQTGEFIRAPSIGQALPKAG
jgi:hypothetical protein